MGMGRVGEKNELRRAQNSLRDICKCKNFLGDSLIPVTSVEIPFFRLIFLNYVKYWVILFNMGEICKICKNMADSSPLIFLLILEWTSNLKHLSHLFRKYSVSKFRKKKKCVVFNLAFDFDHLSAWEWVSNGSDTFGDPIFQKGLQN